MRLEYSDELMICIEAVYDIDRVDVRDGFVYIKGTIMTPRSSMTHQENARLFVCLNVQLIELRKNSRYYYMLYPSDILRLSDNIFIIINHTNFTTDSVGNDMIIHRPYDTANKFIPEELSMGFNAPTRVHKDICNYSVGSICNLYPVMKHSKLFYSIQLTSNYPYLFLYV